MEVSAKTVKTDRGDAENADVFIYPNTLRARRRVLYLSGCSLKLRLVPAPTVLSKLRGRERIEMKTPSILRGSILINVHHSPVNILKVQVGYPCREDSRDSLPCR